LDAVAEIGREESDLGSNIVVCVTEDVVEVRYRGSVTVGSPGRAQLTDRAGGMSELIWNAMVEAGWLGHTAGLKPILELVIRVAPADGPRRDAMPRFALRPGGRRRQRKGGRVREDGAICQHYDGPLWAVAPRVRVVEGEARTDFDTFEDMLYAAAVRAVRAVRAGWLTADDHRQAVCEVPDVDIVVRVTLPPSNAQVTQ
jgi:hypothetical protein